MRGGGSTKEKGILALAWISFVLAAVGGAAAGGTFVGDILSSIIEFFPGWVAVVLFAGALAGMAVDLFVDGTPNRVALYVAMVLPTLARAVPGKLGDKVTEWSSQLLTQVNNGLGEWLGTTSSLAVCATAVVVSLVMARRVVTKTSGGR